MKPTPGFISVNPGSGDIHGIHYFVTSLLCFKLYEHYLRLSSVFSAVPPPGNRDDVQKLNQINSYQMIGWFPRRGENESTQRDTSRSSVENQPNLQKSNLGHIGGKQTCTLTTAPSLFSRGFSPCIEVLPQVN